MRIEKYDDRIVLTNPGLLKLPIEQIYQGGESKARNQRMQNMFRMIGYEVKLTLYLENETNQDGVKDGVKELSDIQESIQERMRCRIKSGRTRRNIYKIGAGNRQQGNISFFPCLSLKNVEWINTISLRLVECFSLIPGLD